MDIQFEKTGEVTGTLVVTLTPSDYADAYGKSLKQTARSLTLPGFRPGKTPVALVKKRYGEEVLAEEVNRLVSEALDKHIKDNDLPLLMSPFSSEANKDVRIIEGETFTFTFDVALKPAFELNLSADDTLPYYELTVAEQTIDQQVEAYRRRGGSYQKVEDYADNDMVKGDLTEVGVEGGIHVEGIIMLPVTIKNAEQKALFNGAKVGDILTINPSQAYEGNDVQLAALLKIDKEEAPQHAGDFTLQITELTRYVPGELNQALYDEAFPEAGITTEEAFRQAIHDQIAAQYASETKYKFILDLSNYTKQKVGALSFPEELLKRNITPKEGVSEEDQEKDFQRQLEGLKWELILEKLSLAYDIKVEPAEVIEMAKEHVRQQYAAYGLLSVKEEYLIEGAGELLKDRQQIANLQFRCMAEKVADKVKEVVTLDKKTVTPEEFHQLANEA